MIEVLSFTPKANFMRTGYACIRYHELTLNCDIRMTKDRKDFWVRMPSELDPLTKKFYRNILNWPDKTVSDSFQKECLSQLKEKFPLAVTVPAKFQKKS